MSRDALNKRMAQEVGKAGRANISQAVAPPPPKEEEDIPDYKDLISSKADQMKLSKLVRDQRELGVEEKSIKDRRAPITEAIKRILGQYKIGKAACNGLRLSYFITHRRTINEAKLRAALEAREIPQTDIDDILTESIVTGMSYQLRVSDPSEKDDD